MCPAPHLISAKELAPLLGAADAPRLIDVCLAEDFALDPRILPGAERLSHDAVTADDARRVVINCQKGLKLSQGVAALLRSKGCPAQALAGGAVGWAASEMPMWPVAVHPSLGQRGLRWVLPDDLLPKDLFAAWCVARLVDTDPTWLFVERDQADAVASRFSGHLPQPLAQKLVDVTGPLQGRLKASQVAATRGAFGAAVVGTCASIPRTATGLARGFGLFDGLWASDMSEAVA